MELLYETRSALNRIRVLRDVDGVLYLHLGDGDEIHSMYDPKHILFVDVEEHYWNYFNLFPLIKDVKKVLLLGLGCGTMCRQYHQFYPLIQVDAIEIDKEVIHVAKEFFNMNYANVKVICGDGIEFVKKSKKKYDLLILDAFDKGNISLPFLKEDVFDAFVSRLSEGGIVVVNYLDESPVTSLVKTQMLTHFEHVYDFGMRGTYNHIIFGCDRELPMDMDIFTVENKGLRKLMIYFKKHVKTLKI